MQQDTPQNTSTGMDTLFHGHHRGYGHGHGYYYPNYYDNYYGGNGRGIALIGLAAIVVAVALAETKPERTRRSSRKKKY